MSDDLYIYSAPVNINNYIPIYLFLGKTFYILLYIYVSEYNIKLFAYLLCTSEKKSLNIIF